MIVALLGPDEQELISTCTQLSTRRPACYYILVAVAVATVKTRMKTGEDHGKVLNIKRNTVYM